jgi:hypothetical protein
VPSPIRPDMIFGKGQVGKFLDEDQATPLTLTVVGHQIVQAADAKGLLLDTGNWGPLSSLSRPRFFAG